MAGSLSAKLLAILGCFVLSSSITPAMAIEALRVQSEPGNEPDPGGGVGVSAAAGIGVPTPPTNVSPWAALQAPILAETLCVGPQDSPWVFVLKGPPTGEADGFADDPDVTDLLEWQPSDWIEFDFSTLTDQGQIDAVQSSGARGYLLFGTLIGPCGS